MLKDLAPDQLALAEYMSELSEKSIHAAWIQNLEHALWRACIEGPFEYTRLEMTDTHVAKLRELSERCGGWIVYDPAHEETFVPMDIWITQMYDRKCAF